MAIAYTVTSYPVQEFKGGLTIYTLDNNLYSKHTQENKSKEQYPVQCETGGFLKYTSSECLGRRSTALGPWAWTSTSIVAAHHHIIKASHHNSSTNTIPPREPNQRRSLGYQISIPTPYLVLCYCTSPNGRPFRARVEIS